MLPMLSCARICRYTRLTRLHPRYSHSRVHEFCFRRKRYFLMRFSIADCTMRFSSLFRRRDRGVRGVTRYLARGSSPFSPADYLSPEGRAAGISRIRVIIARYRPLVTLTENLSLMTFPFASGHGSFIATLTTCVCRINLTNQNLISLIMHDIYVSTCEIIMFH